MRQELTEVQQKVYDFIVKYSREHSFSPTIREIMGEFGFKSTNSVAIHVKNLKKKGYITNALNGRMTARTIRSVDDILNGHQLSRMINTEELKQAVIAVKDKGMAIDFVIAQNLLSELGFSVMQG